MRSLSTLLFAGLVAAAADDPSFNKDVRPILADKCFACHGPDAAAKKVPLRLDSEAAARRAIADGRVLKRITAKRPALKMPPVSSGLKLTDEETATLRKWIETGAKWEKHWSFIAPVRPQVPAARNAIDYFVEQQLTREGLKPSPEATREALIRRVTLDITGVPPTPTEVDAFLRDRSPNAYEKVVERLLASPRYGERMAIRWLDAARYADSNGYQFDGERVMWRWRDWVIDAFNRNMRFDQFTVEQIAGDLLPNATTEQKLATGFNRNHMMNGEGGRIPEESRVENVFDRVETTATVWLGAWAYQRWGPGRMRGMATAAEAEKLLGVTRLRKVGGIVRPDLYGKHAAATPAPVQRPAGDLTEQPGPQLGHGLSPWLLNDRRTKEDR